MTGFELGWCFLPLREESQFTAAKRRLGRFNFRQGQNTHPNPLIYLNDRDRDSDRDRELNFAQFCSKLAAPNFAQFCSKNRYVGICL